MIRLRLHTCAGLAVLLLGAWGSDPALGQTQSQAQAQATPALVLNASAEAAGAEVRAALTPPQQALAVRRFMAALANANGRPVVPPMDAREIASGRAAAADDPALDDPLDGPGLRAGAQHRARQIQRPADRHPARAEPQG